MEPKDECKDGESGVTKEPAGQDTLEDADDGDELAHWTFT